MGISNHTTYVALNPCIRQLAPGFLKTRMDSRQPRAQIIHCPASCHEGYMLLVCNTPSNPWISGTYSCSSLGSYIVCTDQHRSFFAHFVLTHTHPRKLPNRSPVTPLVLLSLKLEHNIMSISISCVCHT
jgi:hypothetical protein